VPYRAFEKRAAQKLAAPLPGTQQNRSMLQFSRLRAILSRRTGLSILRREVARPFSRFHWKREVRVREQLPETAANLASGRA
jgi:hypothetical protein